MPLPSEKSPAQARIGKVFIYGEPKTAGKSTLAMTLDPDRTIALDVEDGLGAIEGFKHRVTSWGKVAGVQGEGRQARPVLDEHSFRGAIQLLAQAEHPFRIAVVDTVDMLAQLCSDYVLTQLGGGAAAGVTGQYVHASDFDYGKGWSAISQEWQLRIGALCRVVESVVLISHADRTTKTDRTGGEFPVFTPALGPKAVRNWTLGFVDHILFAQVEENDEGVLTHCVHTQPSRSWESGGRTVAGGAVLPDPIWLPDAGTAGVELRKALEAVSAPVSVEKPKTTETKPAAGGGRQRGRKQAEAQPQLEGDLREREAAA